MDASPYLYKGGPCYEHDWCPPRLEVEVQGTSRRALGMDDVAVKGGARLILNTAHLIAHVIEA